MALAGFPAFANLSGYPLDLERPEELEANAIDMPADLPVPMSEPLGPEIEEVFRTENQGSIGSCQGCMCAAVAELCYWIDAGEPDPIELSKWAMYRWSQQYDGINGDRGSTLAGGRKALMERGAPLESLCPYPRSYSSRINPLRPEVTDQDLRVDAAHRKLKSIIRIRSMDDIVEGLTKGLGGVGLGILWTSDFDAGVVTRYSGRGGGGHAVAGLRLDYDVMVDGLPGLRIQNSWGAGWINSDRGWKTITSSAMNQIIQHRYSVVYIYSDMDPTDIVTRPFDWIAQGAADILRRRKTE